MLMKCQILHNIMFYTILLFVQNVQQTGEVEIYVPAGVSSIDLNVNISSAQNTFSTILGSQACFIELNFT